MNRFDLFNYRNNEKFIKAQIRVYKCKRKRIEDLKKPDNNKIEKILKMYDNLLDNLLEQQKNQDKILEKLQLIKNTTHRNILFMYYIDGMRLRDISLELDYDYNYIKKQKISALDEFDKLNCT
jgi:hypothetical protein